MQDVQHPDGRRSAGPAVLRLVEPPPSARDHHIELRVDADSVWLPAVRLLAGDLAARADFDVDAVADLRLAVDEACAELLRSALPGATLTCRFAVCDDGITMTATVSATATASVDTSGFGWQVLSTLADEVEVLADHGAGLGLRLGALRRSEVQR